MSTPTAQSPYVAVASQERSVAGLQVAVLGFLRRFGLISALWTTVQAIAAPLPAVRPGYLVAAVILVWTWALASQLVRPARPWWAGWLVVAVALELAAPAAGTRNWSVAGGAAVIVLCGAALTGRLRPVLLTIGVLSLSAVARTVVAPEWSLASQIGTILLFGFVGLSLLWLVRWIQTTLDERDRLQASLTRAERDRAVAVERAEAAARLHDSVLQTLAAVERTDSLAEAKELSRTGGTELRLWIRGSTGQERTLRGLLESEARRAAAGAELSVTVTGGDREPTEREVLVAQATAEAVRNGAEHTDGPIRVYAEGHDGALTVWVADRGAGFDVDSIPEDRAGVRDSIVGRLKRAGGSATLRSGPSGSEWELSIPSD